MTFFTDALCGPCLPSVIAVTAYNGEMYALLSIQVRVSTLSQQDLYVFND